MLWFTAAARRPTTLLPRWLFPQVKGKHQGKSESQCPHWESCTDFSKGGISPGSCCNIPTWFTHVLCICFILHLERHLPHSLVTVASTDKVLSKIKMLLYWNKWPYSIGLKDYISVTTSTSLGMGTLCLSGLPPEELGCALVLHHPPQPSGPRGQGGRAAPQGTWVCRRAVQQLHGGTVRGTQMLAPTSTVPSSMYLGILWGFLLWNGARNCHWLKLSCQLMDVKQCQFYQYYGYLKMPVMLTWWILKKQVYFCKQGFGVPLCLTCLESLRFVLSIFPEDMISENLFCWPFFFYLSFLINKSWDICISIAQTFGSEEEIYIF